MLLTIRDETASGSVTHELTLDVLTETITVRELIRARVYQEVQDYNVRRRTEATNFRGLVTPSERSTAPDPKPTGTWTGRRSSRKRARRSSGTASSC